MMEETGVGIQNPLFFVGVVENNVDERLEGRVQVRAFGVHGTVNDVATEDLPWAILISGSYDPNVWIPPLNSWVFGFFIDGRDAQQPMILGLIPTQMTEAIDPQTNGWGRISTSDYDVLAQGSRPQDFGQPALSRLARAENLEETYVLQQETFRIRDVSSTSNTEMNWSEPAAAYNAQYPFNHVTETPSGHVIELDDTPGGERIMIWHRAGSYVQIDTRGTTTIKSASDRYDVNDQNFHVYVGGRSMVTIMGDSYVNVLGNKIEEIGGNLQQIVRGNYELSVGGQLNLNGGDELQFRSGKVRIESNVENISLKSAKSVMIQSGQAVNIKSGTSAFIESAEASHIKSQNVFIESGGDLNIKSGGSLNLEGSGANLKSNGSLSLESSGSGRFKASSLSLGGGGSLFLSGSAINSSTIVTIGAGSVGGADGADGADGASEAVGTNMPEPASMSVGPLYSNDVISTSGGGGFRNHPSMGSGGYVSQDDSGSSSSNFEPLDESVTQGQLKPLLDFIGFAEGAGYNTIFGGIRQSDYPSKQLTQLTVQEVLNWQDSIDPFYQSEASGRYQILEDTLRSILGQGVISANSLFDGATQDACAIYLMQGRGLNSYLAGTMSLEIFGNNLAKEWASFPMLSGPKAGRSYYAGDSVGNQSRVSISEFKSVLEQIKTPIATNTSGPF